MNNLKKLITERFKASSKKSKDKKFIKDQVNFIKKDPNAHYEEIRSYYKKHKYDENDKIVRKYKKLMGDRSLTEYFDDYYKDIYKHMQEAIEKNPSLKNEDMDSVFKKVIYDMSNTICGEFVIIYKKIFRDQNILMKNFSTDSKVIYKKMKEVYSDAKSEVDKAYNSCKNTFETVVEAHLIGNIETLKKVEFQNLGKLIMGDVSPKYAKGNLETSIHDKNYLVGMRAKDGKGKEDTISNSQSQYSDETLKTNINMAIKELLTFKKKAKYVTEKDIEHYKKGFNEDVSLLERCIAGMKKFAEELPKMVNKCAEVIELEKKEEMNKQLQSNITKSENNHLGSNTSKSTNHQSGGSTTKRSSNRSGSNASKRANNRSGKRTAKRPRIRNKKRIRN